MVDVDRDALVAHVQAVAADFHGPELIDVLPDIIDAVIAHGGIPVAKEVGVSLRWPLNGPPVPVMLLYLNQDACLELNFHRKGPNATVAAELERRLIRALPQTGGTLGQRPNFSVDALTLPDSRAALAEVLAWLGQQAQPSTTQTPAAGSSSQPGQTTGST